MGLILINLNRFRISFPVINKSRFRRDTMRDTTSLPTTTKDEKGTNGGQRVQDDALVEEEETRWTRILMSITDIATSKFEERFADIGDATRTESLLWTRSFDFSLEVIILFPHVDTILEPGIGATGYVRELF